MQQGHFDDVILRANQALEAEHDAHARESILYCLTVSYRQKRQYTDALSAAKRLLEQAPEHARAHQELGYIYLALAQPLDAANGFYHAARHNPALIASWRNLALLHEQAGNQEGAALAQAQLAFLQALPPKLLGAHDLFYDGQIHQAEQLCRSFLSHHKHHPDAMLLLAQIGIQLKVYQDAEFLLESCIELHPNHQKAGIEYLRLLAKMGKFQTVLEIAEQLLKTAPTNTVIRTAKANALVGIGELDAAISIYQELLTENVNQASIYLLLGHALKAQGKQQEAVLAYQQAYNENPSFGDAFWSLANTKTYTFTDSELASMQAIAKDSATSKDDKVHTLFALGKAFEDKKQYADSFDYYQQGNALKQLQYGYNAEFIERQVEEQIRTCTAEFFAMRKDVGCSRTDPIFIVGLPRAGSTLLEQILASHSQVDGTMELHNVMGLVSRLRGQTNRYPDVLPQLQNDYFKQFGEQYIKDSRVYRRGGMFFIDKMPNNFLHIGLIKCMLPHAKIIDARRNPMACCFGGFKQLFGEGQEFTYDLTNIGRYYRAYEKLMAHWDNVLPGYVLRVNNEDVIADLEGQVRRILAFCGLPFEDACLRFHETQRVIKTPSSEQVRQPVNAKGVDLWKHYKAHLTPLKNVLSKVDGSNEGF